jgi:hypothetical protein
MSYNTSAYFVFVMLMVFIILYVGKYFYTNGRIFILSLFKGHAGLTDSINKILLIGYYLLNIGYTFLKLKSWQRIHTLEAWFSSLAVNMGALILILAVLHYCNMLVLYCLSKSNSITHKSLQL